ncbi:MEDS domain-containing protein [Actinocorallia longicatena]|uniref:STAS domain-containing protein n=1 Tax=Actinocorallia longicatena TaxID=111803 RepID=A0ABP6QMH7_9ACTN
MTHLYTQRSVGDLRPGDHAWLAFAHPDEQSRVLGDFVYAGLDAGEKVICVTDSSPRHLPGLLPLHGIDATPFAEAGHLAVVPWHVACARDGFSDPALLATTLEREIAKALDQKFQRVRITADMTWAAGLPGGDQFMLACDNEVEAMIGPSTLATGICQVDRGACTPEAIDVLQHHHEVLVEVNPEYDDGVLRITRTYRPHGLKLEGEIDGARHAAFTQTLTQVSDPRSEVHLDLDKLRFIDLGALSLIGTHALRLTRGNGLVLDNPTPELQGVIDMVGFHRYPGITRGEGWRAQ